MAPSQCALGFGVRACVVAVDGDQPERRPVAEDPLEVVEQAPVDVAAHVDAVVEAGEHARERALDVLDALGVVGGADAVLGDEHGHCRRSPPRRGGSSPRAPRARTRSPSASADARLRAEQPVGPDADARVASARRRSRRRVAASRNTSSMSRRSRSRAGFAAVDGLVVGHGERQPDRRRPGAARGSPRRPCRCAATKTSLARRRRSRVALPGREDAVEMAEGRHDVRLVDGAGAADHVAECAAARSQKRAKASAVAGSVQPPRAATQRGVVKWWNVTIGSMPALVAGRAHAAVVIERGARELAFLGLDAAPLEREAVGAEAEIGAEADIFGVAVPVVAGVAARLLAGDPGVCSHAHQSLFQLPPSTW